MDPQTPADPKSELFQSLRDHQDSLRDHPSLVQRWGSVCWEVLGTPCLKVFGFRDLSRFHHREIMFLGNLGEADCFGPTHNSQLCNTKSICFQTYFYLIRFTYVFNVWDFHNNTSLELSDFQKFSRFHHLFWKALWEDECFGVRKIIPELSKFQIPKKSFYVL